jgi:O-antigen/teichoic acid export membrane protein
VAAPPSLRRVAAAGASWTILGGAVTAAVAFAQTAVLAHILEPADFGLITAATIVVGLGMTLAGAGLGNAIIVRDASRDELSSLYWLTLSIGAILFVLVWTLAPLVAEFYREPRVTGVVRWASISLLLAPVGQQFLSLLQRDLEFRSLTRIQIVSAVAGSGAAILYALFGGGAYALVAGALTTQAVSAVQLAAAGRGQWRPGLRLRWSDVSRFLDFGLFQMGERLVNYAGTNVDYVIIGRLAGPAQLGIYSVAFQLISKPLVYVNPMLNRVAFPVFAKRKSDNGALRRGYLYVVRTIALVTLPPLFGLAVVAPEFVAVVLGERWTGSTPIIQILSLVGALKCLTNPIGSLLLAKNRPGIGFTGNVLILVAMIGTLSIVARDGAEAVAWGVLGVVAISSSAWVVIACRLIHLRFSDLGASLLGPVLFALVTAASMELARQLADPLMDPVFVLIGASAMGGATYVALLRRFERAHIRETRDMLSRPKRFASRVG